MITTDVTLKSKREEVFTNCKVSRVDWLGNDFLCYKYMFVLLFPTEI